MFRGLYIAATGMMLQRRKMETIVNNITNSDTNGFKKDYLISHSFDDVMLQRINDVNVVSQTRFVGPLNFGTQVDMIVTDFDIGNFEDTGSTTDLLIAGDGFFVIETPQGERYTRAGAFQINSGGYLIDGNGYFLLGTQGRIYVGNENFRVADNGSVFIGDELVNKVRVVSFADNGMLRKEGNNLYSSLAEPAENAQGIVKQGFLENSNVEIAREMVDMLSVYRAYETNQRMITMIDEINGKAVNEIGRVR
jgi:flagellar basal-body rod protein FlgG